MRVIHTSDGDEKRGFSIGDVGTVKDESSVPFVLVDGKSGPVSLQGYEGCTAFIQEHLELDAPVGASGFTVPIDVSATVSNELVTTVLELLGDATESQWAEVAEVLGVETSLEVKS